MCGVGWIGHAGWMLEGALQKLVLVVTSVDTKETLERWTFDIQGEDQPAEGRYGAAPCPSPWLVVPAFWASKAAIVETGCLRVARHTGSAPSGAYPP